MELKIVVYSKSACPQCESAKMLLKTRSIDFEEIKIDGEKWIRAPVKVPEPTFQPKINKRSKNLDRKADVVVLL